jgi:hypothetical protein
LIALISSSHTSRAQADAGLDLIADHLQGSTAKPPGCAPQGVSSHPAAVDDRPYATAVPDWPRQHLHRGNRGGRIRRLDAQGNLHTLDVSSPADSSVTSLFNLRVHRHRPAMAR